MIVQKTDEVTIMENMNEVTEQAIKDSFEHPEYGTHYDTFEEFVEAMKEL